MHWLSHAELREKLERRGYTFDDIPTVENYSSLQPCAICGKPGEIHHWAPQAWADDFGEDWTRWPTAPLCLEHHQKWHRIVTPSLVYHDKTERD